MDQRKAIMIIVAILISGGLAACCIIGGVGYYLYQNDQLPGVSRPVVQPTPPPVAQNAPPTPLPPTRMPPTNIPPTAVPTLAPTEGPTDRVIKLWTFDQAEGWAADRTEGTYNVVDKKVSGGKYDWQITARQPGNHQTFRDDLGDNFLPPDYYQLSVEGQRMDGTQSAAYGVVFNYVDGDNFITFLMNDMGNCLISQRSNGRWQNLGGGVQSSAAIRSGEVNYIDVKVSPTAIYAYINGQLAVTAENLDLGSIRGTVGLSAELYNTSDTIHVQFDNFEVLHPAVFGK